MLAHIKGCAQGNVANREHAVDRLRVLIELLIRELHLIKVGSPAPAKYDNATTGEVAELFRTIPDTTPQEHGGLADTVGFQTRHIILRWDIRRHWLPRSPRTSTGCQAC